MTADVAAPLNGNNVRNAAVTAGSFAEPERGREKVQDRAFGFVILRGDIRPRCAGDEIGERRAGALRFILPH